MFFPLDIDIKELFQQKEITVGKDYTNIPVPKKLVDKSLKEFSFAQILAYLTTDTRFSLLLLEVPRICEQKDLNLYTNDKLLPYIINSNESYTQIYTLYQKDKVYIYNYPFRFLEYFKYPEEMVLFHKQHNGLFSDVAKDLSWQTMQMFNTGNTTQKIQALNHYTGNNNIRNKRGEEKTEEKVTIYSNINSYLRGIGELKVEKEFEDLMKLFNDKKFPMLKSYLITRRCITFNNSVKKMFQKQTKKKIKSPKDLLDTVIIDEGFMSSSMFIHEHFCDPTLVNKKESIIMFVIISTAGTKCMFAANYANYPIELEIIFPPKTGLYCVGVQEKELSDEELTSIYGIFSKNFFNSDGGNRSLYIITAVTIQPHMNGYPLSLPLQIGSLPYKSEVIEMTKKFKQELEQQKIEQQQLICQKSAELRLKYGHIYTPIILQKIDFLQNIYNKKTKKMIMTQFDLHDFVGFEFDGGLHNIREKNDPNIEKLYEQNIWSLKFQLNDAKNVLGDIYKYPKTKKLLKINHPLDEYKSQIPSQIVTNAWLKMYEMCHAFGIERLNSKVITGFCNAELPGAFISAINHYLATRSNPIGFDWVASSLYPESGNTALEDVFGLYSLNRERWLMNDKMKADLTNPSDIVSLCESVKDMFPTGVDIYTSDVGIGSDNYDDEEEINCMVHLGQVLCAFKTLRKGGFMCVKTYLFTSILSISIFLMCMKVFEKVYLVKPESSRSRNSEIYIIGVGFVGHKGKDITKIINKAMDRLSNVYNGVWKLDMNISISEKLNVYNLNSVNYKLIEHALVSLARRQMESLSSIVANYEQLTEKEFYTKLSQNEKVFKNWIEKVGGITPLPKSHALKIW